jgi:endoglucanase
MKSKRSLKQWLLHEENRVYSILVISTTLLLIVTVAHNQPISKRLSAYTPSSASSTSAPSATGSKTAGTSSAAVKTINPTGSTGITNDVSAKAAPAATMKAATNSTASAAPAVAKTATLYANPSSNVASNARAWATANPSNAGAMNRLAATPMAQWFGDFSGNAQTGANQYVTAAIAASKVPVLVAYNIPQRDCGSYSSGGATSATAYQSWINSFAAGIGQRSAIVIVEPDALADMDCLSASDQTTREQLLSYAVQTLRADTKAAIYLDAGHYNWQSVATMTSRLNAADMAAATGFSLNVSNFETTANNTAYGTSLSATVSGKHFVIDTSRNGNGPASGDTAWCNPDGRSFGNTPTLQTGNSLVDAYLWVKAPGESDGQCGPAQYGTAAPAAGVWWPQYALMLEANSGW